LIELKLVYFPAQKLRFVALWSVDRDNANPGGWSAYEGDGVGTNPFAHINFRRIAEVRS
jgi:hypothetical protein